MTYGEIDKIAVEIVNMLAEREVAMVDIRIIFDRAREIAAMKTKVKKIG